MSSNRIEEPEFSSAGDSMSASEADFPAVEEDILGSENPKIVEWEDLEQELARLWSLSSELKKAKEQKESLAQRLESIIEVRRESLRQSNELEEMRQKLEDQRLAVGDLSMRTKEASQDAIRRREQLCIAIRTLLIAAETSSAAHQKLQEANKLLSGRKGLGHLKNLQKMLRTRQQYMITQVNTLYSIKAPHERSSREKLDLHYGGDSVGLPSSVVPKSPQTSSLTILGLQLTAPPLKKMSFFADKKEVQMSATALGYVAHAVLLVASYLDVPLRYPLRFGGSRSFIHDYAPSIESTLSDSGLNPIMGMNAKSTDFPLFLEGQDTTRAAYAIFLLNKDLEQLLNYIGADSLGPRHVLANLKELVRIIQSPNYIDK